MACDTIWVNEPIEVKTAKVEKILGTLERQIQQGIVQAVIGPTGAVTFKGWNEGRDGMMDACALRRLLAKNSPTVKRAIAAAELRAGRKLDQRAIAAGWHSHDGKTWSKH